MDIEQIINNRVVYEIPGMTDVSVNRDNVYKVADGQELMFDVYSPPDVDTLVNLPAVIFVHGDGMPERLRGAREWGQYVSWGQLIGASGMRAVVANHRSSQGHMQMYNPCADVTDLITTVRNRAHEFGIDRNSLAIFVCSAGGPFGMRAALQGNPPYIKVVVAYYALMDLVHLRETIPPMLDEMTIREFSATYVLEDAPKEGTPPILIAKAGNDSTQFNASIDRFIQKATSQAVETRLLTHPNGQHGFDIFDDDDTSKDIIRQTLVYLKMNLL
jgi:acetyl esterase/lipase